MTNDMTKAYKNLDFLNSPAARTIRILCEYEEPKQRFLRHGIQDTIVFFGSARAKPREDAEQILAAAKTDPSTTDDAMRRAELGVKLADYYEMARELARRLTEWSMAREARNYTICTGGGPGIMEAANRGAADVVGGRSVGLGISLPFEEGVNEWVPKDLAFEFHYFFMRKLWFMYYMKAMVVFPGGFGTMDELFESLTLIQTGKVRKKVPTLLFGTAYWSEVFRPGAMADFGTISPGDIDLFYKTDSVDEAFEYITAELALVEGETE